MISETYVFSQFLKSDFLIPDSGRLPNLAGSLPEILGRLPEFLGSFPAGCRRATAGCRILAGLPAALPGGLGAQ